MLRMSRAATPTAIRTAQRVDRFTYAIRNIVVEAKKVEQTGKRVRYLNIGDPNQFGFLTPPHLIDAVDRAMRDGHNGYTASPGGIELALTAIVDEGESVLVPSPTYPLYTAVLAKIGAEPAYYRTDPSNGWLPDLDHIRRQITRSS
jgi:alanine-synthesizing transaminase